MPHIPGHAIRRVEEQHGSLVQPVALIVKRLEVHPDLMSSGHTGSMIDTSPGSAARFEFGANWRRFIDVVDDERVTIAEDAVKDAVGADRLDGKTFLDIGCGSGLFSLGAHRLGADVYSFDYDSESVAAAREIQRRFVGSDAWPIEQGSVLDAAHMDGLGTFDVVYSFGVLHHTGAMWDAIAAAEARVAPGGTLYISLYNDQDRVSTMWRLIKQVYNRLPRAVRPLYVAIVSTPREIGSLVLATLAGRPSRYIEGWTRYRSARGMSRWHDMVDWVGGLPFEVAQPGDVVNKLVQDGFVLTRLVTVGRRLGCNEFVFQRSS